MEEKTKNNWYNLTVCSISFDHYLNGPLVPLGSALNEDDAVRMVKRLGVDMVQAWSQHADGKAVYPTKYSEFHPSRDLLDFWSKVSRRAGVRFSIYYSSLVNRIAAERHPEWTQRNKDGVQYTRWNFGQMCTNSPFIDEILLPQIGEMMEAYHPDGFWFDGDSWAVHPCWCDHSERAYYSQTGNKFLRAGSEQDWLLVSQFARESFEKYHRRVVDLIRKKNPAAQFCSNWAYSLRQPDKVPDHIGWLGGDVLPSGGLWQISLESKFLTNQGKPHDIMTWDQSVVLDKNGAWLSIAQKPLPQILQEGSLILANGGRWFLWHSLLWDGWMSQSAEKKLRKAVAHARRISRMSLNTESFPDVAVLHSQTSLHHSNLYDAIPNIRDTNDSLPGVRNFLVEARRHFDVINDETLINKLPQYRLLILPEQVALPNAVTDVIRDYVRSGGAVICAESAVWGERALPDLFRADPVAPLPSTLSDKIEPVAYTGPLTQLSEVFGIDLDGAIRARAGFIPTTTRGEAQPVFCYWYAVTLRKGSQALSPLWNHHDPNRSSLELPSSTMNRYGKGLAVYIPAPIFSSYGHLRYPFLQEWFEDKINRVSPRALKISGDGNIEVSWRKRGREQYIHLVNLSTQENMIRGNVFVNKVPSVGPFSLEIMLDHKPARVFLKPSSKAFKSKYANGKLTAAIPQFDFISTLAVGS